MRAYARRNEIANTWRTRIEVKSDKWSGRLSEKRGRLSEKRGGLSEKRGGFLEEPTTSLFTLHLSLFTLHFSLLLGAPGVSNFTPARVRERKRSDSCTFFS